MADALTAEAVRDELSGLPDWSGDQAGITRTVELATFPDAITLVDRVAVVAEDLDHHPDIDIRWRTVTFRCVTHSVGCVTHRDLDLARRIDGIVEEVR
ncbi:4a-hydroxytetrahydrobiopterin dehydratase [Micromonospora thermarum]|uniref:Putative pterin-4-alpha-carbinolamine dehydratase n=1 Tax=Micromonospora thermarum TaxID=2720024 RepID=A0ABX0Z332_9ACTN|nr:4a-hydroxytetrahydrobiopterin dehydratase [Micromonospora thermarum]NJP32222.1 4a-hydroxytetrahydrobiopterin dehydratase [Micromonospora thermarum]